jgi:cytosine/uracil/thiamine/allantoin permease
MTALHHHPGDADLAVRAAVAVFWYGAQTYFASTAIALALNALLDSPGGPQLLGMDGVAWVSYVLASAFAGVTGTMITCFAAG